MKLIYQINDSEGLPMGLIKTDAPYKEVDAVWSDLYNEDEPDDSSYMEELEKVLDKRYPGTERMYIESEINP